MTEPTTLPKVGDDVLFILEFHAPIALVQHVTKILHKAIDDREVILCRAAITKVEGSVVFVSAPDYGEIRIGEVFQNQSDEKPDHLLWTPDADSHYSDWRSWVDSQTTRHFN